MPNTSSLILAAILIVVVIAWLREQRSDIRIMATQDKLIAEQKRLLLSALDDVAGLKACLRTEMQAHQHTLDRWEGTIDRRGAAIDARPDIDAVVAERRAAPWGNGKIADGVIKSGFAPEPGSATKEPDDAA